MYISGSFYRTAIVLLSLAVLGKVSAQEASDQDTLRTFGPRIGVDLAPFIYYFTTPRIVGAEVSLDFEIYKNIYPVVELGYSSTSESEPTFDYESRGNYGRFGLDYNLLPVKDRSWHNTMTIGFRYGISLFNHSSNNIVIYSDYWGDYIPEPYESSLTAHWFELTGGIKVEIVPNLALGWLLRYKFLLNQDMDPNMIPALIPGYGNGADASAFGFSYSIFYMIPLIKK